MRIALIDRTRVGLLFGWSWFPAEDENDFEENNYEDLCTHEDWTDEDDMRYHQWELERKLDQVDLELQHEKLMG